MIPRSFYGLVSSDLIHTTNPPASPYLSSIPMRVGFLYLCTRTIPATDRCVELWRCLGCGELFGCWPDDRRQQLESECPLTIGIGLSN